MKPDIKKICDSIVAHSDYYHREIVALQLEILIAMVERDESEKFAKSLDTLFTKA